MVGRRPSAYNIQRRLAENRLALEVCGRSPSSSVCLGRSRTPTSSREVVECVPRRHPYNKVRCDDRLTGKSRSTFPGSS